MTTEQKHYSCQGCDRDDLTLTRNGRVRSHAANGKRVGPDNPACPEGSNFPVQSTEHHTHRFEYGDDGNGHSGSVCTVGDCGMAEPENAPDLSDDPSLHVPPRLVPPNPFRDPAPGGVWDTIGTGRPEIPRREPEKFDEVIKEVARPSGPAPQPTGPVSADDFLDDDDHEEEARETSADTRPFWPARYDGTCYTCGIAFYEGEGIRKVDGGYEAEECCGPEAREQDRVPDRPKAPARTLPVVNGRYKLPHPETGKPVTASRSSKYAEGIADSYMLDLWRHRMILAGLVADPEILEKVASAMRDKDPLDVVKNERSFLNKMADNAMTAAGGDRRSTAGTTLHKYTEEVDAGTRALADVPDEYRRDAAAYVHALNNCGFRPVKGLIERSVYCDDLKVSGTFDRVLECVRDTGVLDLDGRKTTIHAGEFVIGDVKSGDNIKHPWLEILIQESIYAHGVNENGVAVQDDPDGPFRWVRLEEFGAGKVREDVGVVMHIPYGSGECRFYAADLITGWRGAQICKANREFWKIELPKVPIATYAVADTDGASGLGTATDSYEDDGMVTCFCGAKWDNIEIANAYGHDREECDETEEPEVHAGIPGADHVAASGLPDPGTALAVAISQSVVDGDAATIRALASLPDLSKIEPDDKVWDWIFKTARTREEANDAWREAKARGVPEERIKQLVALVKLEDPKPQTAVSRPQEPPAAQPVAEEGGSRPPAAQEQDGPTLTERAHRVTTKAEASAVFHEANDKINKMPEDKRPAAREYRDKLVAIMKERLAKSSS